MAIAVPWLPQTQRGLLLLLLFLLLLILLLLAAPIRGYHSRSSSFIQPYLLRFPPRMSFLTTSTTSWLFFTCLCHLNLSSSITIHSCYSSPPTPPFLHFPLHHFSALSITLDSSQVFKLRSQIIQIKIASIQINLPSPNLVLAVTHFLHLTPHLHTYTLSYSS